jgi:transcriptional regulator with XRE-family HTH domain
MAANMSNDSKFLSALGKDVKRLRGERSQIDLGKVAKIPQSRLSDIESGDANLKVSTLLNIARALRKRLRIIFE